MKSQEKAQTQDAEQATDDVEQQAGIVLQGVDLIPFPFHIVDRDYRVLYMNAAAAALLGKKKEDCIGKHCYDLYKTSVCNTKSCPCRVAIEEGRTNTIDIPLGGGRWIGATGVAYRDENDRTIGAIEYFPDITAQKQTVQDLLHVGEEARNGNLSVRTNLDAEGDFLEIAKSVNGILEAVVVPLQGAARDAELIGKGQIPEKVDATGYRGEFKKLVESFNSCIDGLESLREGSAVLQRTAQNDYTRKVEGNYPGGYAVIAAEINAVQDRLLHIQGIAVNISRGDLSDLKDLKAVGKRSENDQLIPAFTSMEEAIQELVNDANTLAKAGREGRLSTRAAASKHAGEFAKVVEGVNQLMDAVVAPVNEAMRVAGKFSVGDYTVRFSDDIAVAGDFQKFKESLNEMAGKTSAVVTQIKQAADQVQSGVSDASKGADEIAKAAEQVAITGQKCADLNRDLLSQMEEISHRISDLSASNEEMASTSQEVLERAENVAKMGRDAEKLGKEANTKITVVEKIAQESVKDITELTQEMREINKIVKLITDISNQTNLLALNAAIEAARAGEHGRGFAVVAGEVRNLAGESKKATNDIENLITSIQAKSEKTATAITSANSEISSSVESVNNAILALNKIVDGASEVTHDMSEIAKAVEDQANTSNAVVQIVDNGTRLTQETMKQVSDLAALAEEASASTEEIGSVTHQLDSMAGELKDTMKQFRV
ncbi:MAG: methyl-accepting chemotaxis protein [Methanofollis sp.]|uniref:methyl-accepting chemotaxis protein n=1 Tax=Methanofollis sp. TaxID=2052835 RepID=UPI002634610F|nr:methyl-accepting chemotaxis protein [Methanofollis sp.]MDD4254714.1 methyl-accepting chemotaxis protein [Methanofollis sp.]